jgi:hypothetical protein
MYTDLSRGGDTGATSMSEETQEDGGDMIPAVMSVKQAYEYLGVSKATLHKYVDRGKIQPATRDPRGVPWFTRDELDRVRPLMQSNKARFTAHNRRKEGE